MADAELAFLAAMTPARDEERGPAREKEKEGDKDATEAEWFTPLVVASFAAALLAAHVIMAAAASVGVPKLCHLKNAEQYLKAAL